jgi:flagellar motor switch protein FliG
MMATANPRVEQLAKVLVALGRDRAAAILQTFPEEMLPDIADAMTRVPELEDTDVTTTLQDVLDGLDEEPTRAGDMKYAMDVIETAFGSEKSAEVRDAIDPSRKPFGFLLEAEPELAARAISREPIGSLALALASLDATIAAKILKHFDEDAQAELHMRIATLAPINGELFNAVELDMRTRITPRIKPEGLEEIPGLDVVVEILGQVSKKVEKRVLEQIAERDEELAARIKESLFVFDDIAVLDNRAIQEILKSVDTSDLSLALYPAAEDLREKFMSNLSTRARENLAEEIEFLRNPAGGDIKAAQKRIVANVRTLEEAGSITIERGGGGDDDDDE